MRNQCDGFIQRIIRTMNEIQFCLIETTGRPTYIIDDGQQIRFYILFVTHSRIMSWWFVQKISIILPQSTRAKLSDVNGDYQKKETGQYSIIYDKNTGYVGVNFMGNDGFRQN